MIDVYVRSEGENIEIDVGGHANSAPKGEDLVCAAATILIRTLAKTLEAAVPGMVRSKLNEGDARVKVHGYDPVAAVAIETVLNGYRLLQAQYPEFIKIFEKREKTY